ncbi:D-2-hydroxyacid dehydrogenase [Candidatus Sumerlaeota bacterium]
MRIVVLDGYTLNPGDLSWEQFQSLGECVIHDRTPVGETVARSLGAEALFTNKTPLPREVIDQLPDLKYIGVLATGYNIVDIEAAAERQIPVTNVPEYGTQSVSQMVFAHVLNFCNRVAEHSTSVRQGKWSQAKDFCFWDYPLVELAGRTMGIVGLGRIGSAVANVARALGMKVLAHDPAAPARVAEGVVLTELETVFRESDVVSLHCPLTEHNHSFVNAELLSLMKQSALLINTSRGPLIDEAALAEALNQGIIAGAALDVLATEPPAADCPLLTARNCFITPHIAWATRAARQRLMATAFDNVKAFLRGDSINVVNGA